MASNLLSFSSLFNESLGLRVGYTIRTAVFPHSTIIGHGKSFCGGSSSLFPFVFLWNRFVANKTDGFFIHVCLFFRLIPS